MSKSTAADQAMQAFTCDLLVAGSGAGGMSAAIVAAKKGLKVIVAEKEPVFGGTTALSGGFGCSLVQSRWDKCILREWDAV